MSDAKKKDWRWFEATANQAAADWMAGREPTKSRVMKRMAPEIRGRAFSVGGIEDMKALARIRDLIAKLPAGASWDVVKSNIAAEIDEQWGGQAEGGDVGKYVAAVERRAELVLRQNAFQAYAVARYQDQQELKAAFPYLMYLTAGDENVRDEHAELDGVILPVDDPFWISHYPPWDFGCRCLVVSVSAEEAKEKGVWEGAEKWEQRTPTRADKGYAFRPDTLVLSDEELLQRGYVEDDLFDDYKRKMNKYARATEGAAQDEGGEV